MINTTTKLKAKQVKRVDIRERQEILMFFLLRNYALWAVSSPNHHEHGQEIG
jgi:hypothetical protein